MAIALDGPIREIFIPELNRFYAAPTDGQMYSCCDRVVEQLAGLTKRFTRAGSINDGATSWVEYIAGLLRGSGILDDSKETGGLGKIAPLAFRHYAGEEGGRLPGVDFYPEYSAAASVFKDQRVIGIEKVTETGLTWAKFNQQMSEFEVIYAEFATLVSKLPEDAPGPKVVGHRASSPDVWYIFPPQRPTMVRKIALGLLSTGMMESKVALRLVELFSAKTEDDCFRLADFCPPRMGDYLRAWQALI